LRNLVTALFENERIETTVAKAKETRRVAERMITFAKRGDLHSRRIVSAYVMSDKVVRKLFDTIAPWYSERNGGYTRFMRLRRRLGDGGEICILELVKTKEQLEEEIKKRIEKRDAKLKAKEEKRRMDKEAAEEEKRAAEETRADKETEGKGDSEEKHEKEK